MTYILLEANTGHSLGPYHPENIAGLESGEEFLRTVMGASVIKRIPVVRF